MPWNLAKAAEFEKIASKFETSKVDITLHDIRHLLTLARVNPSRAVKLIADKQNSIKPPAEPDAAARALSSIGAEIKEVTEQAFEALLQNTSKFSQDHIYFLIISAALDNPIPKIETSSYPFKINLLGFMAQKGSPSGGFWDAGNHAENAAHALCRIGGKDAESQMIKVIERFTTFSDTAETAFPGIKKSLRLKKIMAEAQFTSFYSLIHDLKRLDDGRFVDHLSAAAKYVTDEGLHEIIRELSEQNSQEAAQAIASLNLDSPELKLAALDALGSMRHHAVQNGVNDIEPYNISIRKLLLDVVNIGEIERTAQDDIEKYKLHFADATKNGIIPETYATVFTRAANLVEEQEAVAAAIAALDQSETGMEPRAFQ